MLGLGSNPAGRWEGCPVTITRKIDGKEQVIELTPEEVGLAYVELRRDFDKQDILDYAKEEQRQKFLEDPDLLEETAIDLRVYLDNSDEISEILWDTVDQVIDRHV